MSDTQLQSAKFAADALLHQLPTVREELADIQLIEDRDTRIEAVEDVLRNVAVMPEMVAAARQAGVSAEQMLTALAAHSLVRIGGLQAAQAFARATFEKA